MQIVAYFAFLLWISLCFAKVEIAVEGKHGWAADLPTWRLPTHNWASMLFFWGKPATGYHIWMETFILSMLHFVYVFAPLTWTTELQLLAFFFFFSVLEDFFWFLLNPAFGLKNFNGEKIWWHSHWLFGIPRSYYIIGALGIVCYALSFYV
jgi:hypothetical protein